MASFVFAVFLSAFLLFQVQPLIARYILPWYGGSPSVWTACMMFFQLALLCGYLYAHLLAKYAPVKKQPMLHLSLLSLSLLLLPIGVPEDWVPTTTGQPALEIILLLLISVGIPFILISASGPLLQHWFAGVHHGKSPFRLYAVSNLGSLLALLSYPVLFEPNFTIDAQAQAWSVGYFLLLPLCALCGVSYFRNAHQEITAAPAQSLSKPITLIDRILWVALAACGSTLLLAMTNQISQDVAVVPFLWILPLSIYLLTFIICFDKDIWYKRWLWIPLMFVSLGFLLEIMFKEFSSTQVGLVYQVGIHCLALFTCCMVCHGELVRRRPAATELTNFYLYVALGGALGGIFVNIVAPMLFTGFWELHVGLAAVVTLTGICLVKDQNITLIHSHQTAFSGAWSVLIAGYIVLLVMQIQTGRDDSIYVNRGFFGVIYVDEWESDTYEHERTLYHGRIEHGTQYMFPSMRRLATSYYGGSSGVSSAIRFHPRRKIDKQPLNIGIVGLGVGTLATYGTSGDSIRFYEINPQVEYVAREYFLYLSNSKASIEVVLGDARISMQQELLNEGSNNFDVLVLDAFSSDAIPVHLLTEESFELYLKHLKKDGILAIHITNQHIDLSPIIRNASAKLGKEAIWVESDGEAWHESSNDWVLVTSNEKFLQSKALDSIRTPWTEDEPLPVRWTDDFSSLYQIVDWGK